MRARRAERCFQRTATAIENGSVTQAQEALDEARSLSPADPRVGELESRLVRLHGTGDAVVEPVAAAHVQLNPLTVAALVRPPVEPVPALKGVPPIHPEIPIAPPVELRMDAGATDIESAADGAFEPMVELDRMRAPSLEGWSGLALAPPSREWNRTAGVVACGLLISTLVGWQAWAHKDLITALPNAQPDVDATTGLAASPPPSATVASSTAPEAIPSTETAAPQPDPKVAEELVPPLPRSDAEVTFASDPKPVGSTGDSRPLATNAVSASTPSEASTPTASPNRELVAPSTTPSYTSARRVDPIPTPPVTDTRPPAASTPVAPESTSPLVPAPSSSPVADPPAIVPDPAAASSGNAASARMEAAPSLPSPAPSIPSPSPSLTYAARDQSAAVRATLNRYEAAYTKLDVAAVQSVWPSLDGRALARAFDGLTSQRVSLGNCSVNVNGTAARADCSGTAAWTPKVGGGEHITPRKWTFDLTESDGGWRIVRVQAR